MTEFQKKVTYAFCDFMLGGVPIGSPGPRDQSWEFPGASAAENVAISPRNGGETVEARSHAKWGHSLRISYFPTPLPRCDSHRNCVWLTRLTRASNRFDPLAIGVRYLFRRNLTSPLLVRGPHYTHVY